MFKNILVAVAEGPGADAVFAHALSLARLTEARLIVLHALSAEQQPAHAFVHDNDSNWVDYMQRWKRREHEGSTLLQHLHQQAAHAHVPVEILQQTGSPGPTICRGAQEQQADLIVVGRRVGPDGLPLGSTSTFVLHHAPCAVQTVPLQADATP